MATTRCDFLLVAAVPREFHPGVRGLFGVARVPKSARDTRTYYETVIPTESGQQYTVRILCVGRKGGTRTTAAVVDAVGRWQPRHVIMFGIAAVAPGNSRKKGDILVAEEIFDIEEVKKGKRDFPRPHPCPCEDELVDHISEHFGKQVEDHRIHIGAIVSQPNLSRNARYRDQLVAHVATFTDRPVIGLEMEGGGLATAVRTRPQGRRPGFLLIKGAVDWGNYHKNDRLQRPVALRVARFVRELLVSEPIVVQKMSRRSARTGSPRTKGSGVNLGSDSLTLVSREAIAAAGLTGLYPSRDHYRLYRPTGSSIDGYVGTAQKSIVLVSINLMTGLPFDDLCALLERKLEAHREGITVTISLLDPFQPQLMAALAPPLDAEPDQLSKSIVNTLSRLVRLRAGLSRDARRRFDIRVHKSIPFGSAIMIDHRELTGRIQIETKPYKAPLRSSFAFEVGPTGRDDLFTALVRGYEQLCRDGEPVAPGKLGMGEE